MSVNKCLLLGNLGQDPETKYTQNGNAVTNLSLATTKRFKDKSGQSKEKTEWHRIVVWGKQAETCALYLSKGSKVYVEGKIETRSWEGEDGKKNYTTEIKAQNVQFLDSANQNQDKKPNSPQSGFNLDTSNVSIDSSFTTEDIPF